MHYNNPDAVKRIIAASEGMVSNELIGRIRKECQPGSKLLELGMGPGNDLLELSKIYNVVGSDLSLHFLEEFSTTHWDIELRKIDARSFKEADRFDCIYSNKLMHHFSGPEILDSFSCQISALNSNGLLVHTFWRGDDRTSIDGLNFNRYRSTELTQILEGLPISLEIQPFSEFAGNDMLLLCAKKT